MGRPWWYEDERQPPPRRWPKMVGITAIILAFGAGSGYFLWRTLGDGDGPGTATKSVSPDRLLSLADLPKGWTTDPATREEASADPTGLCSKPVDDFELSAEGTIAFKESQFGPIVVHAVLVFEASSEARRAMIAVRRAIDACGNWTERVEGSEVTLSVGVFRFPHLGDDTIAYRVEASAGFFLSAVSDAVLWRRGSTLSVLSIGDVSDPDPGFLRGLVERADLRVRERPIPGPTPIPAPS